MENIGQQKLRILKLLQILKEETDDENSITSIDLLKRLKDSGYSCTRKTLYDDIALLNSFDMNIEKVRGRHANSYYIVQQQFSVSELKIIIDALRAANFISESKTEQLISKIAPLGGKHKLSQIKAADIKFNTKKHSNNSVIYNIETIVGAINGGKKISFKAFDLDYKCEHIQRNNGELYIEDPIALIYNDDYYYVLLWREDRGVYSRRIDRIENVSMLDECINAQARERETEVEGFCKGLFRMYAGEEERVTIAFTGKIINNIFDRLGEGQEIKIAFDKDGNRFYTADIVAKISPTFFGWIAQFPGNLKIVEPQSVVDRFNEFIKNVNELSI